MNFNVEDEIAALIDHTLLKPEATRDDIVRLCSEARAARFASVCINPAWVPVAVEQLRDAGVRVCTVIGFPLGASRTSTKIAEATTALAEGARELDMVLNIGALRSGDSATVEGEIASLAETAHQAGALLKVIFETCLLTDEEKILACQLSVQANADFVKTSTGFSTGGATVADVTLMFREVTRREAGRHVGVKASGGVRTLAAVKEMVAAGATRIGTSSGLAILREAGGATPDSSLSRVSSY